MARSACCVRWARVRSLSLSKGASLLRAPPSAPGFPRQNATQLRRVGTSPVAFFPVQPAALRPAPQSTRVAPNQERDEEPSTHQAVAPTETRVVPNQERGKEPSTHQAVAPTETRVVPNQERGKEPSTHQPAAASGNPTGTQVDCARRPSGSCLDDERRTGEAGRRGTSRPAGGDRSEEEDTTTRRRPEQRRRQGGMVPGARDTMNARRRSRLSVIREQGAAGTNPTA